MKSLFRALAVLGLLLCAVPAEADNFFAPQFPIRINNANYLRITNTDSSTRRARCIGVVSLDAGGTTEGSAAVVDLNITASGTGDCRPASGIEWLVHGIVHQGPVTIGHYDGTNLVNFGFSSAGPSFIDLFQIDFVAQATPATPGTGKGSVYFDSVSKKLCAKDDTGAITCTSPVGAAAPKVVQLVPMGFGVNLTTGDGKDYFVVPASFNGLSLISVSASLVTVSSSGAVNVDIARCAAVATGNQCTGTVVDVLSTNLTIDANENKSSTAATAVVIDTANDDVATDQVYRIDIDGAGTGAQGLILTLSFQ